MRLSNNQPLWMPSGSVRAIIALLLVIPLAIIALRSGITLTGDQLIGVVGLVVTAYFVQKAGENGNA